MTYFEEGYHAFMEGKISCDCTYVGISDRCEWLDGFREARAKALATGAGSDDLGSASDGGDSLGID